MSAAWKGVCSTLRRESSTAREAASRCLDAISKIAGTCEKNTSFDSTLNASMAESPRAWALSTRQSAGTGVVEKRAKARCGFSVTSTL